MTARPRTREQIKAHLLEWSHEPDENECWVWFGPLNYKGYPSLTWTDESGERWRGGHRVAYVVWCRPIPEGLQIDHLCRVPACINPSHMEPVTGKVNTLRGVAVPAINARKTECVRGHEFTPENTLIRNGKRTCRMCKNAQEVARRRGRDANYQPQAKPAPRTGQAAPNAKTHCKNGHEFTPENTVWRSEGGRRCRECQRLTTQRNRARERDY